MADPGYADAVATYLGLPSVVYTDYSSSISQLACSVPKIPLAMSSLVKPFRWFGISSNLICCRSSGSFAIEFAWIASVIEALVPRAELSAIQADAATRNYSGMVLSTDPPYYDNIGYSDLSDYFYVWLRRTLRSVHPDLLATMLVPEGGRAGCKPVQTWR